MERNGSINLGRKIMFLHFAFNSTVILQCKLRNLEKLDSPET